MKYTPRHQRDRLEDDMRRQVIACVAEAMLCALNDVGREYTQRGERFSCSLQLCAGTKHFMDWTRQLQSIPAPFPQLARDEDAVWMRYPDVHFECICAHESICRDLACGFTDARFVEMIAAKYRSLRLGIVDALADLLDDESSALHRDYDEGAAVHQPRGGAPHSGCSIGMNARISLVTGGSRGLGAAICTRFAEEGYAVAIEYASHEKAATQTAAMVRKQQNPVAPFRADASDETEVRDMIRRMREEPGARRIITLSSQGVRRGSIAHAHCAASKMGIIGCTRSLARELGADGITVNAVAPGRVMADMLRANLAHSEKTETWLRETPWGDSGNRGRSRRRSRSRVGPGLLRHGPGDARRWRIADAVMVGPTLRLRQRNWHATGTTSASVTSMPGASRSFTRTFSSNSAPSRSCGHQLI